MRLVLDANVLIAAFVARGVCAELLEHCVREHEPVTSEAILEEVRRNLVSKIKVTVPQADQTVKLLRTRLGVVEPVVLEAQVCRDADDDVVLGTAIAGQCDAIVTGDKDLLDLESYRGIPIVTPRAFWSFELRRRSGGWLTRPPAPRVSGGQEARESDVWSRPDSVTATVSSWRMPSSP